MSKGGVIVRLIDIVLLLLFGFLAISEIEKKSPIKIPQSMMKVKSKVEEEEIMLLGIGFDKENKAIRYYFEGENITMRSMGSVKEKIIRRKKTLEEDFHRKLKVRIRSDWNLPIKLTMKIVKFCQKNGIKVGLDVQTQS